MANIDQAHWNAFLAMLREVEHDAAIPIHFDDLTDVLWTQSGGTYSDEAPVVACVALGDQAMLERANESRMVLVACASGFPQPRRSGFSAATLGIKIVEIRPDEDGENSFPLHYDLFPGGRRVLEMPGLRLDTEARLSNLRTDPFRATVRALSAAVPDYHRLVTSLVETFPDKGDQRTAGPKRHALAELVSA
jgi:hypothetical protein